MALDTRKWELKEGGTLAWVRATLIAGVKYPWVLSTKHK